MKTISTLSCGTAALALCFSAGAASAQTGAQPETAWSRFDAVGRLVGTISPDPDGAGPLKHRAVRNVHDVAGRLVRVERGTLEAWQPDAVAPKDWPGFTVLQVVETAYDALDRKVKESLSGGGAVHSLTQYGYDQLGRLECTAVRMNPAAFPTPPDSACLLGPEGPFGPDRITRNSHDAAGQLRAVTEAVGTADEATEIRQEYTPNGQLSSLTDGNGNRTEFRYDGHDREMRRVFPSLTTPGAVNEGDFEAYGYDANGNRTSKRLRDGQVIGYSYDALDRMDAKDLPNAAWQEHDVTYAYDNLGRLVRAQDSNTHFAAMTYDALGRRTGEASNFMSRTYEYDRAGQRKRLNYGDGFFVDYDYLTTGEMTRVRENGAVSGVGVLATYGYDDLGRRRSLTRGNGAVTSYGYDGASRLTSLVHDLAGTSHDQSYGFAYNPSGQITSRTASNDAYAYQPGSGAQDGMVNGRNQLTAYGYDTYRYDARGNFAADDFKSYAYTSENRLAGAGTARFAHDPLGRMHWEGEHTTLQYDGEALIRETDNWGGLRRRHVHGAGVDEPLVTYEGGVRRWLHADERGSIVSHSDGAGVGVAINGYDEYGLQSRYFQGRFGYTGQVWLPDVWALNYKARIYMPGLGRFKQPDPIGYDDGPNLYAYVGGDPVNKVDPDGQAVETIWDGANVAIGIASGLGNYRAGNYGAAIVDGIGVLVDGAAVIAPGVPGGAATAIKAARASDGVQSTYRTSVRTASSAQRVALQRQLALREAWSALRSGKGTVIAGQGAKAPFRQATMFASKYGGNASDYVKVSYTRKTVDGLTISVHVVRNKETGKIVEAKVLDAR